MGYEPHTWVHAEKITSEKLNHMEQGIADASVGGTGGDIDLSAYAPKANPVFTGSISMGRLSESKKGNNSVVLGSNVTASAELSYAIGLNTIASGDGSFVQGYYTIAAGPWQVVIGQANVESSLYTDRFIVGNGGTRISPSNCFRVTDTGVYAAGMYNSSGADYAELMEWEDGNPDNEDRVGLFVSLVGSKIRIATPGDKKILGIVSGNPSVCGDVYDDQWQGMYLYDIFGRPIYEDVMVPEETMEIPDPEDASKMITQVMRPAHMEHRQKLNPNYDNTQKYIPRSERPEWDAVGMVGKLVVIDDGTCEPGGYCTVGYDDGVATAAYEETKFNVMERLDNTHIRVMIIPH